MTQLRLKYTMYPAMSVNNVVVSESFHVSMMPQHATSDIHSTLTYLQLQNPYQQETNRPTIEICRVDNC